MMNLRRAAVAASAAAMLALAPTALASGGVNSGGVNSGGVNSGGGGGGTGGGGTTSTQSAGPCVQLQSVAEQVGYYSVWAAIWHHFTVKSCSSSTQTTIVWVTDTNTVTGAVDFTSYRYVQLTPGQNIGSIIDNDFAPFSTTYNVTTTATDMNGNALATATVPATTPPAL